MTDYYGNDKENPDFITNSRTFDFYVREDITLDFETELSICDTKSPYFFKISDIITGNSIEYDSEKTDKFVSVCNFFAEFKDYPYVKLWIEIHKYNDKLYLQDVYDSDYYEITDTFQEDIYRLEITDFD